MQQLENTLYVTTQGTYIHLERDTLIVEVEKQKRSQIPLHHIGAIVCFGNVMLSPFLVHRCAEEGRNVTWLDKNGRYKARMVGPVSGNVLLRKGQYKASEDERKALEMAKSIVGGKVRNSRTLVMRAARESGIENERKKLYKTAERLARIIENISGCGAIDSLRGMEGDSAKTYFNVITLMIRPDVRQYFEMSSRSRRPPRDPINALLSFLYSMLTNDLTGAVQGVGLDPQVGFLHTIRPGRPALALDMVEELRSVLADRLALALVNRKQISDKHFEHKTGGAVMLNEKGRKEVIVAYQERKQKQVNFPSLDKSVGIALIPHLQARVMARCIRGDLPAYLPFIAK